jgi:hypothetical protein
VDALERDDLEAARHMTPEERARDLFEVIRTGFWLNRASWRARFPGDTDVELDVRFQRWLDRQGE